MAYLVINVFAFVVYTLFLGLFYLKQKLNFNEISMKNLLLLYQVPLFINMILTICITYAKFERDAYEEILLYFHALCFNIVMFLFFVMMFKMKKVEIQMNPKLKTMRQIVRDLSKFIIYAKTYMFYVFGDMTYSAIIIILDLAEVNKEITWWLHVIQAILHMIFFVYCIGLTYYFLKMAEEYFTFYQYTNNIKIRERFIFYTVSTVFFMSTVN